jgi:cell division protein FtsZ
MTTPLQTNPEAPSEKTGGPALKKQFSIKVCGIGGAGCNAAAFIAQSKFDSVDVLLLNTDAQALATSSLPGTWVLGRNRTRGLGTGGDPDLGRAAAEDDAATLASFCAGADLIFILAGLGGGTGTGAAPVLARVARETGALVLAMATLPFDFEGPRRRRQADLGLQQLKAAADAVICLPNQKLFKLLDENTSVLETFKAGNRLMADGLLGIWRLLSQTGLINLDFADLCSVTRGRHLASSFATAEAGGEKRGEQVIEKLLAHPLLDGGQVLNESDAVLVSIAGGPDLAMSQVNRIMEPLQRQCENAHLIFGAVIDPAFAGRLSVTLIASGRRPSDAASSPAAAVPAADLSAPARGAAADPPALARAATADSAKENASAMQFLDPAASPHPPSRCVAPAPEMSNEKKEQLYTRQTGQSRRKSARLQKELPLEIVFKGRFDKSEPTIRHGEDLDLPTYIRKGVALN